MIGPLTSATFAIDVADLDAAVTRLSAAGVPVDEPVTVPDVIRFCDLHDLDGNVITLYEVLAAPTGPSGESPAPAG